MLLRLVAKLWSQEMVDQGLDEEEEAPEGASESSHGDRRRFGPRLPTAAEMALYPTAGSPPGGLSAAAFADTPSKGKYGDPMDPMRWAHYMSGAREPPKESDRESTQEAQQPASSTGRAGRPEPVSRAFQSTSSRAVLPIEQWNGKTISVHLSTALGGCSGRLHVPAANTCANAWLPNLDRADATLVFPPSPSYDNYIRFPIFMPSSGRPSSALLGLSLPANAKYFQVMRSQQGLPKAIEILCMYINPCSVTLPNGSQSSLMDAMHIDAAVFSPPG